MEDLITILANYGFAIGVGAYLVYYITTRINTKLDEIRLILQDLLNEIKKLNSKVG